MMQHKDKAHDTDIQQRRRQSAGKTLPDLLRQRVRMGNTGKQQRRVLCAAGKYVRLRQRRGIVGAEMLKLRQRAVVQQIDLQPAT